MNIELWQNNSIDSVVKLGIFYDRYVKRYEYSYREVPAKRERELDVWARMSMSAFFDIDILKADPDKVAEIYCASHNLSGASVFQHKLVSLRRERDVTCIIDFLKRYDAYIVGMDEFCQGDCPVCLNEYLDAEYFNDLMEDVYERLDEAFDLFEECIDAEGAVAMRERNAEKYYILQRFLEQFDRFYESIDVYRITDADLRILEEMDVKLTSGSLLPHILAWAKDRNIRRAVDSGTFDEMFSKYCGDLIASKKDIQE